MGFRLANTCFERVVCGYFTLGSAVGADSPHEARNVTRYCSDLGALASKSPAKRSVGHPAPRVHRASCLGSTPGRQSRSPLALRTRAPHRRRLELDDIRTVDLWAMDCDFVLLHSQPPVSPSLANTSALRTARIREGVPAMLFSVSVVTLQLVFTFAMSRTEASVSPPASVPKN